MNNELKIFENEEFGSIRTIVINGEPWFVGRDVAEALGYGDGNSKSKSLTNAISDHVDDDDKKLLPYEKFKGYQNGDLKNISHYGAIVINESGIYSLTFSSKLPTAKKFKHWVTSEVLPQIRKTGAYNNTPKTYSEALRQLADKVEENERLQIENQEMKPKSEYFDNLVDKHLLTNFRDTAKEFGIKEKVFIKWLLENNYLYRDNKNKLKPFAKYITGHKKFFEIKEWKNDFSTGTQTLITPRGKETFRLYLS